MTTDRLATTRMRMAPVAARPLRKAPSARVTPTNEPQTAVPQAAGAPGGDNVAELLQMNRELRGELRVLRQRQRDIEERVAQGPRWASGIGRPPAHLGDYADQPIPGSRPDPPVGARAAALAAESHAPADQVQNELRELRALIMARDYQQIPQHAVHPRRRLPPQPEEYYDPQPDVRGAAVQQFFLTLPAPRGRPRNAYSTLCHADFLGYFSLNCMTAAKECWPWTARTSDSGCRSRAEDPQESSQAIAVAQHALRTHPRSTRSCSGSLCWSVRSCVRVF